MTKEEVIHILRWTMPTTYTDVALSNIANSYLQEYPEYHQNELKNHGDIGDVSSFLKYVYDEEPPKNTELIAVSPSGVKHITSWRDSYKIFSCQCKDEGSLGWQWLVF